MRDHAADIDHEEQLEDHEPRHGADAERTVQQQEPDADERDDPEAGHALGAHGAAQHLVVDLAVGVQLGHAGVEEAEVHDRHGETDDQTEGGPRHESSITISTAAAPTMREDTIVRRSTLAERVALETREPVEHVSPAAF